MIMVWRSFHSEWVKMRRRRLWYGCYGAIAAVVVLTTIVTIAGAHLRPDPQGNLTLAQLAQSSGLGQGLSQSGVLLGAVSFAIAAFQFGAEFSHGTLRNLLVRQPRRWVLMTGKCLAVLTFLLGAVAVATSFGICAAFVMAHLRGIPTEAWTSGAGMAGLGTTSGDTAISACGFAIIGMIAGVLLRSSVIAIAAGLAVLLPIETIITDAVAGAARWLPAQLLEAISQGGTATAPFGPALATMSVYLAAAVAITMVVFVRRDVTA
ncbi:MAG: ABC transporter permease [Acidimicrobiales bacterium]|jgi:ABC-type transport system involved in multi-copper enzyme maturation permease subunit